MELAELKIIVTGAASGMGAYFARQLVQAGAEVAAGDLDEQGLAELKDQTTTLPGTLHTRSLDVVDEQEGSKEQLKTGSLCFSPSTLCQNTEIKSTRIGEKFSNFSSFFF